MSDDLAIHGSLFSDVHFAGSETLATWPYARVKLNNLINTFLIGLNIILCHYNMSLIYFIMSLFDVINVCDP